MIKTLYIHAGIHKTGTTSIQKWCDANRGLLKKQSIDYVEMNCIDSNHATYATCLNPDLVNICRDSGYFLGLSEQNRYNYSRIDSYSLYRDLVHHINESEYEKFLISSECFLEGIDLKLLSEHLSNKGFAIKFIIYLRPQQSWIQSVYKYVVMDKDLRYCGDIEELPQVRMLDYHNLISPFIRHFGVDSITLKNYNSVIENNDGLLLDFVFDILDCEENILSKDISISITENKSFSYFEIKVLNLLWKLERKSGIRLKFFEGAIYKRYFRSFKYSAEPLSFKFGSTNSELFKIFPNFDTTGFKLK